jgi:outer membrane protein assembly factor BamE
MPKLKMPEFKMPRVHKINVQQGNLITQEMIDKLKPGMSRSQVAFIMGEPIYRNTFNEDRWDYIYTITVPGFFETDMRMSLFFEDDALSYFTGDLAPSNNTEPGETEEEAESREDAG